MGPKVANLETVAMSRQPGATGLKEKLTPLFRPKPVAPGSTSTA